MAEEEILLNIERLVIEHRELKQKHKVLREEVAELRTSHERLENARQSAATETHTLQEKIAALVTRIDKIEPPPGEEEV